MLKPAATLDERDREESEGLRPFPEIAGKKSGSKTAVCQSDLHRFVANLEICRRERVKNTSGDSYGKKGDVNIHIMPASARAIFAGPL